MKDSLSRSLARVAALDELARQDTAIHRLHPLAKVLVTLGFVIGVIASPRYNLPGLCPFFLYPFILAALGEVPFSSVLTRVWPALPFVLFAGLSNLLLDRAPLFAVGGVAVSKGAVACLVLVLKTFLSVSGVILLCATTPGDQLIKALSQLSVPEGLTTVCLLCFRYLSLLMGEAAAMTRAYSLRSTGKGGVNMRDLGSFGGQLLLRSADRAERVYGAMCCRGYTGRYPASCLPAMKGTDRLYLCAMLGVFLLLGLGGRYL